jgi:hypothetical protein
MESNEHFYYDDPTHGPVDAKTTLKDVNYFFLGNGFIEAAVQLSPANEGTPVGVILMHPEKFGPKRQSVNFDPESGFAASEIKIFIDGQPVEVVPAACWKLDLETPAVEVTQHTQDFQITEIFYCPDRTTPRLRRLVTCQNLSDREIQFRLETGIPGKNVQKSKALLPQETFILTLVYSLDPISLGIERLEAVEIEPSAQLYWQNLASGDFGDPKLNHLFNASKFQLQSNIAQSGMMDASIWQYNLEWVRDQSNVVMGLIVSGQFELARTLLDRILTKFVTENGDTVDSSRVRPPAETELDQNGVLLLALKRYVDWTGDFSLVEQHWAKIVAVAEYPLQPHFRHEPSGLLHNVREYWERHDIYGILDGMELNYQVLVCLGLAAAAEMARSQGQPDLAERWDAASRNLRAAILADSPFSMLEDGHFIKRRLVNGQVQREIFPSDLTKIPPGTPLAQNIPHLLNPDAASVLPIVLGLVPPHSDVALKTLEQVEKLYNMNWDFGGYSRYHISSEGDSPGPWPLASVLIAQAYFEAGDHEKVWRVLRWLNSIGGGLAGTWFEFYGPRPIPPCPQIGILPWTWAEILKFFIHHLLGIRPDGEQLILKPVLLPGLTQFQVSVRLRNLRLSLDVRKARAGEPAGYQLNGNFNKMPAEIRLEMPKRDLKIEIFV